MKKLSRFFKDLPIGHKLLAMMFGITFSALIAGFSMVLVDMVKSFQKNEASRMAHVGRLVADFSLVPLAFEDVAGAVERLEYLETLPGIAGARILRPDGRVFATWMRDRGLNLMHVAEVPDSPRLFYSHYRITTDIAQRDQRFGEVVLFVTTKRLWSSIERSVAAMLGIMAVVLWISFVFAYWLQKALSTPILKLAEVTRAVSEEADFRVHVQRDAQDELADLYTGFNAMMERIREREAERDRALEDIARAHDELELRVMERTSELSRSNQRLSREIGERLQAERRLKSSLAEKEVLLREIHHRVKNNLQIIYSLLALQARDGEAGSLDGLEDSRRRIKTMALVHETLYHSGDLSEVDATAFIEQLTRDLETVYLGAGVCTQVTTRVDPVVLSLDQAVPIGLILNELLTNAFKYAFPDGQSGKVEVGLRQSDRDRLVLSVSDDGVGLPRGLNWRQSESLGLQLVTALAGQLRGDMALSQTRGCRFVLVFDHDRRSGETDQAAANG